MPIIFAKPVSGIRTGEGIEFPDGTIQTSGFINNTPTSSSGIGHAGQFSWDSDYVYVCIAENTWKRFELGPW